jgi:hypothetical protein
MGSGFRASELASLDQGSFDLDGIPPTATVQACYTKNRQRAIQPLPEEVANLLREYLARKPAKGQIWPGKWVANTAEMLRHDLRAAGIPYRDEDGRVADFHALRHSFITLLSRSGASPKVAQELARHGDIKLTLQVYTHLGLHDTASLIGSRPSFFGSSGPGNEALAATGTHGKDLRAFDKPPTTGLIKHDLRLIANESEGEDDQSGGPCPKPLEMKAFDNDCDMVRSVEKKLPAKDSNLNQEAVALFNSNPCHSKSCSDGDMLPTLLESLIFHLQCSILQVEMRKINFFIICRNQPWLCCLFPVPNVASR